MEKFEGLILALFSAIFLIGIANAQGYHEQPYNTTLLNQSSCFFNYITISTNANVINCFSTQTYAEANASYGTPYFLIYNFSKNPYPNGDITFTLPNGTFINLPANSNFLISIYPNGTIFENNKLLYKILNLQNEIGIYEVSPNIKLFINYPALNISIPNNHLVFGYEHDFDNLTIRENSKIDMLELFDIDENIMLANSTSPLIYNLYKLIPINYAHLINPIYNYPYPFSNISESLYAGEQNSLVVKDENISYVFYPNEFVISFFKPYFWINNSEPALVTNVIGSKVLEINFTNVNPQSIHSIFYCNVIFENKLMENLNFQTNGNIILSMATNPNETEIIDGNLIYKYGNKTYYYNFTNLSLTQGQLKRIIIPVIPITTTKTPAKCNIELCILLILIIIIILILIAWKIKKHLEKKKRKV